MDRWRCCSSNMSSFTRPLLACLDGDLVEAAEVWTTEDSLG